MLLKRLFILALVPFLFSCGQLNSDAPGGTGSTGSGSAGGNFYYRVSVGTIWDGLTAETVHKVCTIDSTSTASSEAVPTFNDCHVEIPEAQLYYGDLQIRVETSTSNPCDTIIFSPYYVQRSNDPAFQNPTVAAAAAIDCSGVTDPMPVECFEGAAKELAPSFPINDGMILITTGIYTKLFTLTSGNDKRQTHANGYNQGNMWTTNNMIVADRANSIAGFYLANTMQDWEFVCRNAFHEQLYRMRIYLSDLDSTTAQFTDWCLLADPNNTCPGQQ